MQERIDKLQEVKDEEVHDKRKYMEGAVWLGRRMSNEVERVC